MTKYIDVTEQAKLIRKTLKEAFPGHKFSVRCDRYSGGSSIDVIWTDGPSEKKVGDMLSVFSGSSFDGMIDMQKSNEVYLDGEPVHFSGDRVSVHREDSKEAREKAERETGIKIELGTPYGEYRRVMRYLSEQDFYGESQHSPTLERITNKGADFGPHYPG